MACCGFFNSYFILKKRKTLKKKRVDKSGDRERKEKRPSSLYYFCPLFAFLVHFLFGLYDIV
jgi:hypothetical protein